MYALFPLIYRLLPLMYGIIWEAVTYSVYVYVEYRCKIPGIAISVETREIPREEVSDTLRSWNYFDCIR